MNKAADIEYSCIEIGSEYSFEKEISYRDIMDFAGLTGDFNPLHTDKEFGMKSKFKNNIVHGMLAGSLFSTLVGMYCPGKNSLYLSQSLQFRNVIFPGDKVLVRGTVVDKNESIKVITMKTEVLVHDKIAVRGEAKVRVLED
ncbi:MaoC family dehydratase [Candidatus Woesearchaeota archaeon]|nr:MaoC family dehydratase [Candidatus Woesearchaeota archaeon]